MELVVCATLAILSAIYLLTKIAPPFELGKARPLRIHKKPDVAILSYGVMAIEAIKAVDILEGEYRVNVYDARFAKPVDTQLIASLTQRNIPIITVEDHGLEGGFGSCVIDSCHDQGIDTSYITRLGIPMRWIYQGARTDQLEECGLDAPSIARTIRKVVDTSVAAPIITVEPKHTKTPISSHSDITT